jgi:hypothetical protein
MPDPVMRALWEELSDCGPCWSDLWDRASLWLSGSHPISNDEIIREAGHAMGRYLMHAIPLHLAYILSPDQPGNHAWMKGSLGTGLITMDRVEASITWMGGSSPSAEDSAIVITSLWERSPSRAKLRLRAFFKSAKATKTPRIISALYAANERVVSQMADAALTKFGHYAELNFNYLIPPILNEDQTETTTEDTPGERPAKRQRVEHDSKLIQFWEEPSDDVLLETQLGVS